MTINSQKQFLKKQKNTLVSIYTLSDKLIIFFYIWFKWLKKHNAFPLNVNSVIRLSPPSDIKSDGADIWQSWHNWHFVYKTNVNDWTFLCVNAVLDVVGRHNMSWIWHNNYWIKLKGIIVFNIFYYSFLVTSRVENIFIFKPISCFSCWTCFVPCLKNHWYTYVHTYVRTDFLWLQYVKNTLRWITAHNYMIMRYSLSNITASKCNRPTVWLLIKIK